MTHLLTKEQDQQGFTLIELLLIITIIGILALYAIPSYNRYINEAKAASILSKIHTITMAYADVAATQSEMYNDHKALTSSGFGSPPPYLPGLKSAFNGDHGIALASNWVNHSGIFNHTGHEAFPVLFLKADTEEGHNILRALDHVTQNEHTFVTPNMMMLALAVPHETYTEPTSNKANTPPPSTNIASPMVQPPEPKVPPQVEPPKPKPDQKIDGGNDLTPSGVATKEPVLAAQSSPSNTGGSDNNSPSSSSTNSGSTSSGSTGTREGTQAYSQAASELNWPPGWAKHPEQHINHQHPGHHQGNH